MKLVLVFDGSELFGATALNDDEASALARELEALLDGDENFKVLVYDPDPPVWIKAMLA